MKNRPAKNSSLKKCDVFHEIGHAIIGLIFDGYLMKVEKIILNKEDIKELNLNVNDLAYTHQKRVIVAQEIVDSNEYLYAMINGLNFLGGIAGASFLCPENKPESIEITANNFNDTLKTEGSSGDFEFINGGKIMYSWYLFVKNKFSESKAYQVHACLMNILQEIYLDDRIRLIAQKIYNLIIDNPNSNIEYKTLIELFPIDIQSEFKDDLILTIVR